MQVCCDQKLSGSEGPGFSEKYMVPAGSFDGKAKADTRGDQKDLRLEERVNPLAQNFAMALGTGKAQAQYREADLEKQEGYDSKKCKHIRIVK